MGFGDKVKGFLREEVPGGLTKLGKAMLLEQAKEKLAPHLPAFLDGFGEKRLRFLVEQDISLWEVWEDKAEAVKAVHQHAPGVLRGLPLARLLTLLDPGPLATVLQEVIREKCPQYTFLPREWIIKSLADFRKDLQ